MASAEEDDTMDQFMDKFKAQKYKGAFKEETWEEEFDKIPMFMKKAPPKIDPTENPDLACLQSIIFDEDRSPEEQAKSYKDEGNEYFKEKNYKKAILSYTEGLNKKSSNEDLSAILYTNRAAAQYHLGNLRSALNDAIAARKHNPKHLKAVVRGALCHLELKHFSEAIAWCDEGLVIDPKEKNLLEARGRADKLKRAEQRDARKAKLKDKKEQTQKEAVLKAIQDRKIKLCQKSANEAKDDDEDNAMSENLDELSLNEPGAENVPVGKVHLDENGSLVWPVLFLYPEHRQTDFISAFHEDSRFIDQLLVMFGDELPPWDSERKYHTQNLELYFEDEETRHMYQVNTESTLLQTLQHKRYFIKSGTPAFILFVKQSSFCLNYLSDRKVHRIK